VGDRSLRESSEMECLVGFVHVSSESGSVGGQFPVLGITQLGN
jgi:hypothetical protein